MTRHLFSLAVLLLVLSAPSAQARSRVDLNRASRDDLVRLGGFRESLASRIVSYRVLHGPFGSVDDLRQVPGVSPDLLERLRARLSVSNAIEMKPRLAAPVLHGSGAGSRSAVDTQAILQRFASEPSVRAVQVAAARYAEVHPELIASWRTRARLAALGPRLRAEYRYAGALDTRLHTGGGTPDYQQEVIEAQNEPLVGAEWDLDRLVFNPDELRVADETTQLVRLRQTMLETVTRLYFARRRQQVELALAPSRDGAHRLRAELEIEELTADLDALTGGFFSKALAEHQDRRS